MPFALAFIDIDHFKRLNDTLGHDVGDEALRRVGETLTAHVRQSDAVGRLGGDEFAVLMPGVAGATMHRRFDPIRLALDAMAARSRLAHQLLDRRRRVRDCRRRVRATR